MSETRKCGVCGTPFPLKGKKLYCSPKCSQQKMKEQSQAQATQVARDRAERRKGLQPIPCRICSTPFLPKKSDALYCSDPCRGEGLVRAIRRQQERRQQAKATPPVS